MKVYSPNRESGERGQDLVEFALLMLPLFLLVMGIFDFGRGVYTYMVIYNAVREGCRYGVIDQTDVDAIKDAVINRAVGVNLQASNVTVEFFDLYTTVPGDDVIEVTVNYDFTVLTPMIVALNGTGQFPFETQASMKLEK